MYKKLYITAISLVIACSSNPQHQKNEGELIIALEHANKGYIEFIDQTEYPLDILSQFPKSIKEVPIRLSFNAKNNSIYTCAYLYQHIADTNEFKEICQQLSKNVISIYSVVDENLFVQGYYNSRSDIESGIIPTPIFEAKDYSVRPIYSTETRNGLSEEFMIYVLKSESIYKNTHSNVLKKLKGRIYTKGYTQGIALSIEKQTIIYWTMVF